MALELHGRGRVWELGFTIIQEYCFEYFIYQFLNFSFAFRSVSIGNRKILFNMIFYTFNSKLKKIILGEMKVFLKQSVEKDDSEEDLDEVRPAFLVSPALEDEDLSIPPMTGEQYLRRVM